MSRWGIGPLWILLSLAYGALVLAFSQWAHLEFPLSILPTRLRLAAGALGLLGGILFLAASGRAVMKAYSADSLLTRGLYGWCRHPLYSAWVVFIVPGAVLLAGHGLGLTLPLFMYVLLRILARREETDLENRFGPAYREYRRTTPFLLPVGPLVRRFVRPSPPTTEAPPRPPGNRT